jgi:putative PIN family toxin of toxin-antitoxin system
MTIRIVLDTNILISAVLTPQGAPAQVFLMALLHPDFQLCVSGAIYAEYEEVIRRPHLHRTESEIQSILFSIRERSIWIKPVERVRACSDPDDDIFLECAQAANAQYIITGNTRHFPNSWAGAQVVTAREFLDDSV